MSYRPISNAGGEKGVRIIQHDLDEYVYDGANQAIAIYPIDVDALNLQVGDAYEINIWGEFAANTNSKAVTIYQEGVGLYFADTQTTGTTVAGSRGWKTALRITKVDATNYVYRSKARCEYTQGDLHILKTNVTGPLNPAVNVSIRAIGGSPVAGDITVQGMTLTILRS